MTTTVKGFTPEQIKTINISRPVHVKAIGLSFWDKAQITAAVLLGSGATLVGVCMLWALANGVPL